MKTKEQINREIDRLVRKLNECDDDLIKEIEAQIAILLWVKGR